MLIGRREFDTANCCYVMGILNVTPDSFSDGGSFDTLDAALFRAEQMIAEGAAIIDIGGESTRPSYTQISEEEEISRIAPVIEAIKARFDIPVSLDTYKHRVAAAGIAAGADLINDIWGLRYDGGEMAALIAVHDLPCCLMHNRNNTDYRDFFADVLADLRGTLEIAQQAGIRREQIILDPGVGFAKSYAQNLEVIDRMEEIADAFRLPILMGASRKSVIGLTLGLPANERLEGTLAITCAAMMKRAAFVRVHDVKENVRAIQMLTAVRKGYPHGSHND